MTPVRIALADDTAELRTLLRFAFEADGRFEIVGEAEDGEEALALVAITAPDVLVLDLSMPRVDGLAVLAGLRDRGDETRVVVLSGFDEVRMGPTVRERGAAAYVQKGTSLTQLVATVAEVAGCRADVATPPGTSPAARLREPVPASPIPAVAHTTPDLAEVFHDLASPLAALRAFASTLPVLIERGDAAAAAAAADAVMRSADRLSALLAEARGALLTTEPAGAGGAAR